MSKKRTKFVDEVDELNEIIESCGCMISNGDVGGVSDALDNSLFRRYVCENEDYQVELWKRAAEEVLSSEMLHLLEGVIGAEIRKTIEVLVEDRKDDDEDEDEDEE